jgi:MFS transporter, DHA1 family, multidrug resistance protein
MRIFEYLNTFSPQLRCATLPDNLIYRLAKMDILLRESLFGRTANYLTKDKAFPHHRDLTNKESSIELQDSTGQHAGDLDRPRNWPTLVKSFVMADVMLLNFSFYAASAIYTPSIPLIEEKLGANASQGTLGLSLFVIAYGIGPLIVCVPNHPRSPS